MLLIPDRLHLLGDKYNLTINRASFILYHKEKIFMKGGT